MKWLFPLLLAACSLEPALVPDERATRLNEEVAVTEAAGVRVTVNGAAWNGDPFDLPEALTPLQVTLENGSSHPIRLTWRDFMLNGASGVRYSALPPLRAEPDTTLPRSSLQRAPLVLASYRANPPRVAPRFRHRQFYVAPPYSYYYPGYPLWGGPFAFAPYRYQAWPRSLPTADMLAEALPEGVLESGGSVSGFVYFPAVSQRESRVGFQMRLVDALDGATLGNATVPMRVRMR